MWIIRKEQMEAFERHALECFERRAVAYLNQSLPEECAELGPEALERTVKNGVRRALSYGFEEELDVLRFLNLMFLLDFDFDTKPEYGWAADILKDTEISLSARMDFLYETAEEILDRQDNDTAIAYGA